MAVPLLDLSRQYKTIKDELDRAVLRVFEHNQFILGPEVTELENRLAAFCKTKYAVGVASGTDALLLALRAAGVAPGCEVITSDFSFFASAGVISRLGATPVFVDIERETYNIDPNAIEEVITSRTKAIMPVHLFGQMADMDRIMRIAEKHNLIVVEDAAQAIGARYKDRQAGSIGHYGCFSFFPTKNLGGAGDGGLITLNDDDRADFVRILRFHGAKPKYFHRVIGYNSRLDTLQAAVLLVKMDYLHEWTEGRRKHARVYDAAFKETAVKTPAVKDYSYHIYNQYTISVSNREELMKYLKERKIGHEIYYPVPFHLQDCFKDLGYSPDQFPLTTSASSSVVSLPIFAEMTSEEQQEVIAAVKEVSG